MVYLHSYLLAQNLTVYVHCAVCAGYNNKRVKHTGNSKNSQTKISEGLRSQDKRITSNQGVYV